MRGRIYFELHIIRE